MINKSETNMKKLLSIVLAAAISLAAGCGSDDPQALVDEIAELSGKDLPLTDLQKKEVAEFTRQGKEWLSQGKTQGAVQAFDNALAILVQAEDAAIANKAE
jgi:hypothetical protein